MMRTTGLVMQLHKLRNKQSPDIDGEKQKKKQALLNLAGIPINQIERAVIEFQELHTLADWEEYVWGREDRVRYAYESAYEMLHLVINWNMETDSPRDMIAKINAIPQFNDYKIFNSQKDTYEAVKELLDELKYASEFKKDRNTRINEFLPEDSDAAKADAAKVDYEKVLRSISNRTKK